MISNIYHNFFYTRKKFAVVLYVIWAIYMTIMPLTWTDLSVGFRIFGFGLALFGWWVFFPAFVYWMENK